MCRLCWGFWESWRIADGTRSPDLGCSYLALANSILSVKDAAVVLGLLIGDSNDRRGALSGMHIDGSEHDRFTLVYGCWKRIKNCAILCHDSGDGVAIKDWTGLLHIVHGNKGIRNDSDNLEGSKMPRAPVGSKVCQDVPRGCSLGFVSGPLLVAPRRP